MSLELLSSYTKGIQAEALALSYFEKMGFKLLHQRAQTPWGEIDLVVEHADTLLFIEVKQRRTLNQAKESLSLRQRKRIYKAAQFLCAKHDYQHETQRFDVIAIDSMQYIEHIPQAWSGEDFYSSYL